MHREYLTGASGSTLGFGVAVLVVFGSPLAAVATPGLSAGFAQPVASAASSTQRAAFVLHLVVVSMQRSEATGRFPGRHQKR
jgi:hypothetical protein